MTTYQFDYSGCLKAPTAEELAAADEKSAVLVLDTGTLPDGSPYWAYVAIKPSRYAAFAQATSEHRPISLEDYGTVIHHGFEKDVPPEITQVMKEEYGFDEGHVESVIRDVKQAQQQWLKEQEEQRLNSIVKQLKGRHESGND